MPALSGMTEPCSEPRVPSMSELRDSIGKIAEGGKLTRKEARAAFETIMSGAADDAEIAAFLMGLRMRKESVEEIVGGAQVLREKAIALEAPPGTVDTCGTGGDGHGTFNVSTAAAIVAAACGVPVAKHGNVSVSSKSGSAEVLERLGVDLDLPPERVQACLDTFGLCFLMAPKHHRAMRHVAPVRRAMGIRTVFNVLGPLSNPAGAKRQLIGVYESEWLEPLARTLAALGSEHVWIVHGADGLDELTVTGASEVVEYVGGKLRRFTVTPEQAGLARHPLEALKGGTPEDNAAAMTDLLDGKHDAYRDIVLLNAAATLLVAGKTAELAPGVRLAAEAIDTGRAADLLKQWAAFTRGEVIDVRHAL